MKIHEIKFRDEDNSYSVIIGKNVINLLPKKLKLICPKTQKVALFLDRKVPGKFKKTFTYLLRKYKIHIFRFDSSEKNKSFKTVNKYLEKLLIKNFNRSDCIISVGGGVSGDVIGFIASIYKRGINFVNMPTTLLAQVDASIGGKTAVNSNQGKNLIGSFHQPKLVLTDTSFLNSLPKKEMVCGYAEILKHSIIKDKKFFNWLKENTKLILNKKPDTLIYAIKKSCEIKMFFVNKDVKEKNLRMILNFGHTFAHAIEIKNNYSKMTTHGEAVLSGMILATKLSVAKKFCKSEYLNELLKIYDDNNLSYTYKKFSNKKSLDGLLPFLKNDKKNDDEKINFILLNKIGKTSMPNKFKISIKELKKYTKKII